MTGEELYNFWRDSVWNISLQHPRLWEDLGDEEQAVWEDLAERLAEQSPGNIPA